SAITECRKVLEANPSNLAAANSLGDLYLRIGRVEDAIDRFRQVAEAYGRDGLLSQSTAMFKKISRLDPANTSAAMKVADLLALRGLAAEAGRQYLFVGDRLRQSGQGEQAVDAYSRAISLVPQSGDVFIKLGQLYAEQGLPREARQSFLRAKAAFSAKDD